MAESYEPLTAPEGGRFCCFLSPRFPQHQGYTIWRWLTSEARWIIQEDRSEPGFEPGTGPTQPGRFDGQVVKWASSPASPGT